MQMEMASEVGKLKGFHMMSTGRNKNANYDAAHGM